jgi:hypothetical protein
MNDWPSLNHMNAELIYIGFLVDTSICVPIFEIKRKKERKKKGNYKLFVIILIGMSLYQ